MKSLIYSITSLAVSPFKNLNPEKCTFGQTKLEVEKHLPKFSKFQEKKTNKKVFTKVALLHLGSQDFQFLTNFAMPQLTTNLQASTKNHHLG